MTTPNFADSEALEILRHAEKHTSQSSLAVEIGYSVGKVNYILKALTKKGFIKAERFAKSENKKGVEEKIKLTEKFIERKKREYEELQLELNKMKECS
jgi:DNA-binding MarR family transcriptional regulator